jgi:hypothetical protein
MLELNDQAADSVASNVRSLADAAVRAGHGDSRAAGDVLYESGKVALGVVVARGAGLGLAAAEGGSAKFIAQGFSPAQAQYLAEPYVGMGHHFVPRRAGLPSIISDSPLNTLRPAGISRGDFYELHYKVDPYFFNANFPKGVGGSWRGRSLGLEKYGAAGRLWYGSPAPLKATIGGASLAAAASVNYYIEE